MHPTFINPAGLHDPSAFGYSHSVSIPAGSGLVLVAGQYGSDARGGLVSASFAKQVEQALANLATALGAQGLELRHVVQLRTYVVQPDFEKLGLIAQAVQQAWREALPTQTLIGVASLALPDMLFEVEALAVCP